MNVEMLCYADKHMNITYHFYVWYFYIKKVQKDKYVPRNKIT